MDIDDIDIELSDSEMGIQWSTIWWTHLGGGSWHEGNGGGWQL